MRIHKDALYICTTPFQIMSSISISALNKEKSDLIIDYANSKSNVLTSNIKRKKYFDEVLDISHCYVSESIKFEKNSLKRKLKIIKQYFHLDKIMNQIGVSQFIYDKIYFSNNCFWAQQVVFYFKKIKSDLQLICFDDGEGSYDEFFVKYNRFMSIISLNNIKKCIHDMFSILRYVNTLYLYAPELYLNLPYNKVVNLKQIPKINANNCCFDLIFEIFSISNVEKINESLIVLDTVADEILEKEEIPVYEKCLNNICQIWGDVCIKKHPRDKNNNVSGYHVYEDCNTPIESICMTDSIDENKILLTLSSTAILTPKIIFDQEPYIILLYNLFNIKLGKNEDRKLFYKELYKSYKLKDRIFEPKSFSELYELLNDLKRKQNNE